MLRVLRGKDMVLLINAKRIYRGFDSAEFNRICAKLKENGIEFRPKIIQYGTYSQTADPTQYRIYVNRRDADKTAEIL